MSGEQGARAKLAEKPELGAAAHLALGTAALYVLGYLSLRFQLTALGVSTDLGVLDERYLFAGAKFLVTLASAVPNLLLLIGVPIALLWGIFRILPPSLRETLADRVGRLSTWWSDPTRLAVTGIVVSLGLIQLVMRKCFSYSNLLLASHLPNDTLWPQQLLLDVDDNGRSLFFAGLVAGTAATAFLLLQVQRKTARAAGQPNGADRVAAPATVPSGLRFLLAFLVGIQLLLLPVNHGVLMAAGKFPRIADPEGQLDLKSDGTAWLVGEGHDNLTYLVRYGRKGAGDRRLKTLLRSEVKKIEITGSEPLMRALFLPDADPDPPALDLRSQTR